MIPPLLQACAAKLAKRGDPDAPDDAGVAAAGSAIAAGAGATVAADGVAAAAAAAEAKAAAFGAVDFADAPEFESFFSAVTGNTTACLRSLAGQHPLLSCQNLRAFVVARLESASAGGTAVQGGGAHPLYTQPVARFLAETLLFSDQIERRAAFAHSYGPEAHSR